MNILQKIESKLTPRFSDQAVDKELEGYTVEEIKKKNTFYQSIITCCKLGASCSGALAFFFTLNWFLPKIACLGEFIVFTEECQNRVAPYFRYEPYQLGLAFGLVLLALILAFKSFQFHKIKEALESGLERKIEKENKK